MFGIRLSWSAVAVTAAAILGHLILFLYFFADFVPELSCVKSLLLMLVEIRRTTSKVQKKKFFSIADMLEEKIDASPSFVQFITAEEGKTYTLGYVEEVANQVANWGLSKGLVQQNTVALMLLNRPEFISFWFGMAKIGCTTALLNTNLSGQTLVHSVSVAIGSSPVAKLLVIDDEIGEAISGDINTLRRDGIQVVKWSDLQSELAHVSSSRPPPSTRSEIQENFPLLMIYTSGTTGLPKASRISHTRYLYSCFPYVYLCRLTQKDRVYCSLPFYHSAGGMLGVGACLRKGITMVIRRKFSVRKFADDCLQFHCTSTQYIGELCRYLCSSSPTESDAKLTLKSAFGNGLRPEVWTEFQNRYKIKNIVEFYASTEGNIGLFNSTGKVGALGYIPRILDAIYPVTIIKIDTDNPEEPLRGPNGLCIVCAPDEPGLVVSLIDEKSAHRKFDGYTDKAATNKKIISNVLRKGDKYFNTGDAMRRDASGFFFWHDRIGDTFRWKGENVSTAEVSQVIASATHSISDVAVYGVAVKGYDGKVGMATITLSEGSNEPDFVSIIEAYKVDLPSYARPVFIRIIDKIPLTSTFKHKKTGLAEDGFDLEKVTDKIYFLRNGVFELLTPELFEQINTMTVRL